MQKAKLAYSGNPEGYAVDAKRGRFYTNLEDKDGTVAIDLKTRETVATWNPSCGGGGPHGLALDVAAGHLFIGCDAAAEVMNVGGDGSILSKVTPATVWTTSTTRLRRTCCTSELPAMPR
jgi:hypothetical protein